VIKKIPDRGAESGPDLYRLLNPIIEKQAEDPLPSGGGMNAVPTAFEIKAKPISS